MGIVTQMLRLGFLAGEQACCILALLQALLSAFHFLKPRRNEGNTSRIYLYFFFLCSVPSSDMLNYFFVVMLNGKTQVCESWGQSPSKASKQADELLWTISKPTTHWLWLSRACSHKQNLAENLCYIAFDLCFQLELIFLANFPALRYCSSHAISISQLHLISRLLFKGVFFFCGVWLTFQNER